VDSTEYGDQLVPGSFEYALNEIVDRAKPRALSTTRSGIRTRMNATAGSGPRL
jgi:hypothetical protein